MITPEAHAITPFARIFYNVPRRVRRKFVVKRTGLAGWQCRMAGSIGALRFGVWVGEMLQRAAVPKGQWFPQQSLACPG